LAEFCRQVKKNLKEELRRLGEIEKFKIFPFWTGLFNVELNPLRKVKK